MDSTYHNSQRTGTLPRHNSGRLEACLQLRVAVSASCKGRLGPGCHVATGNRSALIWAYSRKEENPYRLTTWDKH